MAEEKGTNLFLPKFGEWWDTLCLKAPHWDTSVWDFLRFKAAKENLYIEDYITRYGVEIEPIRIDAISFLWMGMGIAYRNFNKTAEKYDDIVEFREYFGERAFFGLMREYIIRATGIKYTKNQDKKL